MQYHCCSNLIGYWYNHITTSIDSIDNIHHYKTTRLNCHVLTTSTYHHQTSLLYYYIILSLANTDTDSITGNTSLPSFSPAQFINNVEANNPHIFKPKSHHIIRRLQLCGDKTCINAISTNTCFTSISGNLCPLSFSST